MGDPVITTRIRQFIKWFLLSIATLALILTAYLWLTMLSPLGYNPPDGLPAIDQSRDHRVFVYGTLRSPVIRWVVMGRAGETEPAILEDHRKEGLDIIPDNHSRVEGKIVEVNPDELRRLDRYERLGIRYERVSYVIDEGDPVWIYRRLP